jgi:hypothetical protein
MAEASTFYAEGGVIVIEEMEISNMYVLADVGHEKR